MAIHYFSDIIRIAKNTDLSYYYLLKDTTMSLIYSSIVGVGLIRSLITLYDLIKQKNNGDKRIVTIILVMIFSYLYGVVKYIIHKNNILIIRRIKL